MRKKNLLVFILTLLIFLSAALLGVSTVYRVSDVTVYAPVVSKEAQAEAKQLQSELFAAYEKDGTLFVNDEKAKAIVDEFPYFHLTKFERAYPNRIVIEVQEEAEVYAVPTADKKAYYILSANGTVLGERATYENRSDGVKNVLISGLNATGEKGEELSGDSCLDSLFTVLGYMHERLDGVRRNLLSVEVQRPATDEKQTMFVCTMTEGVKLYIRNPYQDGLEKATAAMDAYFALSDAERLTGAVLVYDGENGAKAQYFTQIDVLA